MSRATIGRVTEILPFPPELRAAGTADAPFRATIPVDDLPPGAMRRVTFGDLDVLLAHTDRGIVAVDDRCPHMSAPLSIGELDGCVVACPLHSGRFDLATRRSRPDAHDRRPVARRPLRARLEPARARAQGGPARHQGRGPPPDPRPPLPLLPASGSSTASIEVAVPA